MSRRRKVGKDGLAANFAKSLSILYQAAPLYFTIRATAMQTITSPTKAGIAPCKRLTTKPDPRIISAPSSHADCLLKIPPIQ